MRVMVTGSAGFLGRHFVAELMKRNHFVHTCDTTIGFGLGLLVETRERYDLVVHCAAMAPHRTAIDTNPYTAVYNRKLDVMLFDWVIRTQQRHVLYVSSAAVYHDVRHPELGGDVMQFAGTPFGLKEAWGWGAAEAVDPYGETKRAGERMAEIASRDGVQVTVVRPFSGYGYDQSVDFPFGAFLQRAVQRADPFDVWGSATQVRDFIHVDDIVNGALELVDRKIGGPVNLCTGQPTALGDLAQLFIDAVGYHADIRVDRDAPLGVDARVGDPTQLQQFYTPKWTIEAGVAQAVKARIR